MGLDARKPVFGGLRTAKAQTSLRIRAVWSAPFLFAYWNLLLAKFQILPSLCDWADWFVSRVSAETPKTGFVASRPKFY